jgi:hypothetical protein
LCKWEKIINIVWNIRKGGNSLASSFEDIAFEGVSYYKYRYKEDKREKTDAILQTIQLFPNVINKEDNGNLMA